MAAPEVLAAEDQDNTPCPCRIITIEDATPPRGDPELPTIICEVDQ